MSVRGLCRERRYAGEVYFYSVWTRISRVTLDANSCSYTHCVCLFPTLLVHTNQHNSRFPSYFAVAHSR